MKALFETATGTKYKFSRQDEHIIIEFEEPEGKKDSVNLDFKESLQLLKFIGNLTLEIELIREQNKPTFWKKIIDRNTWR